MVETTGHFEEIDTNDWRTCECCGQKVAPRAPPPLLLANHRVETPGYPTAYALKAADAIATAEARWAGGKARSAVWVCSPGKPFTFWRTYPE